MALGGLLARIYAFLTSGFREWLERVRFCDFLAPLGALDLGEGGEELKLAGDLSVF